MYHLPRLTRVPGPELPTRSEGQHYRKDLSKISKPELLEILEREEKLLKNKSKLNKLPDKGQRIREYHAKLVQELNRRNDVEQAAAQFSQLNIASVGRKAIDKLEWTGKVSDKSGAKEVAVDSDDEVDQDLDPLKIIAHSNDTEKIVKVLPPEKPLITEEDIQEIKSFENAAEVVEVSVKNKSRFNKLVDKIEKKSIENENHLNKVAELLEPHALYLCQKENDKNLKPKFLPGRTTVSDVHNPEKEKTRRVQKNWEATAATPPLLRHGFVKPLTLQESIEVQRENIENMKKLMELHAKERLEQREIRRRDRTLLESLVDDAPFFSDYRDKQNDSDESDVEEHDFDSEDEVHDEPEEKGGVVYTVDN